MRRTTNGATQPSHSPIFYDKGLGPNKFIEAQPNLFTEELDGTVIMSRVNQVEPFAGNVQVAANLLDTFHEGALMIAHAVPSIVESTPLWIEFGSNSSPLYVFPGTKKLKPAIVATTGMLAYLSKLPQERCLPLDAGVSAGSYRDYAYTPQELMFAGGVEEAHHATVGRMLGLTYGISIGQVDSSEGAIYMAQEVEWQAGRFVLEALKIKGVSDRAIAAHQSRLDAAKEIRTLVGLDSFSNPPLLQDFLAHHTSANR